MSTKAQAFIVHPLKGGLDTMSAPTIMAPDALVTAENVDYFARGSYRKRLGTSKWAPSSGFITDGGVPIAVTAMQSYRSYVDGTREGTQYIVLMGRTGIYAASSGVFGAFNQINSVAFGAQAVQGNILVAGGSAIFATMLGTQIPHRWDPSLGIAGACTVELDACAPMFGFAQQHLRRVFAAGVLASPSTVFYSAAGDITDWEGEDASSLIFDDGDGDRVVGISKTFRGGIYVFKGGERGSIHSVMGRTVRQFARDKILDTAPAVTHQAIVTTPNDIYWLSPYGVHSLTATEKYGNTQEAFISHDIHNLFQRMQVDALNRCWGFFHPLQNIVGWAIPESGYTANTVLMVYNYVLGKWSIWRFDAFGGALETGMVAPDIRPLGVARQRPRLYIGTNVGQVFRADEDARADNTLGYTTRIKFPNLIRLGDTMTEMTEKSFQSVTTFFSPTATSGSAQLNITIDGRQTTESVSLQSTGGVWGTGTYGSAVWGGNSGLFFTETPIGDRGRSIQLEYVNSAANTELQIYGYAIRAVPAEAIAMEAS